MFPEEELKFHYTVHTSLDVVEEKGEPHPLREARVSLPRGCHNLVGSMLLKFFLSVLSALSV